MSWMDQDFETPNRKKNLMWLTSLADLLALLLAFFVLVFAMNEIKRDTWQKVLDNFGYELNTQTEEVEPGPTAEKNLEVFTEHRAFDLDYLENILNAKIDSDPELEGIEVFKAANRLIISFSGDTYFPAGVDAVSEKLIAATRQLGESLRYIKNRVEVYGHSDPEPIKNPTADSLSNWGLSLSRSLSVAEILKRTGYSFPVRAYGMADSRFFELKSGLSDEEKYALSRRVDIVIREAKGLGR